MPLTEWTRLSATGDGFPTLLQVRISSPQHLDPFLRQRLSSFGDVSVMLRAVTISSNTCRWIKTGSPFLLWFLLHPRVRILYSPSSSAIETFPDSLTFRSANQHCWQVDASVGPSLWPLSSPTQQPGAFLQRDQICKRKPKRPSIRMEAFPLPYLLNPRTKYPTIQSKWSCLNIPSDLHTSGGPRIYVWVGQIMVN